VFTTRTRLTRGSRWLYSLGLLRSQAPSLRIVTAAIRCCSSSTCSGRLSPHRPDTSPVEWERSLAQTFSLIAIAARQPALIAIVSRR
jgi:hypothetical protein